MLLSQSNSREVSSGRICTAKRPSAQVFKKGGLIMGQRNTRNNVTAEMPAVNRNYKSTVFAMLFGDRERLLGL